MSIGVFGIILGIKKTVGSPFITIFSGLMIFALLVLIDNIIIDYVEDIEYSVSHPMNVITSDGNVVFSTTVTGIAERPANINSVLVNKKISCIEVNMFRTNNPTDNVMIGIQDDDNRIIKLFGNITASSINTASRSYQVCLPNHDYWIIAYNDRVGVKHLGSSGTNTITVNRIDGNPFDGTNSVRSTYTSGLWSDTTNQDLRMKLTSDNANIIGKEVFYDFNDTDAWAFLVFMSALFIFIGIILQFQKWSLA